MLELLKVRGKSMEPLLSEGDYVLIFKFFKTKKGSVVVVKDPRDDKLLIKRVEEVTKDKVKLIGDNKDFSTDSRHFGFVDKKAILGRVIRIFRKNRKLRV